MSAANILVVDDEPDIRQLVQEILEEEGYKVGIAQDAVSARAACQRLNPDLVLLDIWMPDEDGITLLKEWKQGQARTFPVIMMSGHGTVETAVEATRLGAYDFVEKPLSLAKLLLMVQSALDSRQKESGKSHAEHAIEELVGISKFIQELRDQAARVANQDLPILITGEPGVGKRTLARYIHGLGRRDGKFIDFRRTQSEDSEALEELLIDNSTQGGTLYIEDLSQLSAHAQLRLLKHLQSSKAQAYPEGWRLIASASESVDSFVHSGVLREDVYFRMNGIRMRLPPLRERREDVPMLLEYFVNWLVQNQGLSYRHFNVAAQNRLRNYHWPGNVGELRKLVQQLMVFGTGTEVDRHEIDQALDTLAQPTAVNELQMRLPLDTPLRLARESFERMYLQQQLVLVNGNMHELAKRTGMERTHLYRKLRSLGIELPRGKSG